jgi:CRISPR/Cas system CMR subunit Cmr6 (Cas7 group RAMP superfamily)
MPNHSSKKKKGPQSNITIDEKHTQMLNEFHAVESDTIPELEQTLLVLKNQFRALDESDIDQKMEVKDQIRDITEQLKKYKTMKNNYLLKNASYIFNYFEEKKKISVGGEGNKHILNSFIPKLLEKCKQGLYSIRLCCMH